MANIFRRIRFFIALPDLIVILFGLALFWRPLARAVLRGADWFTSVVQWPAGASSFAVSVFSDMVAAGIIAALAILFFWSRRRHALAGTFNAYEWENEEWKEWGEVRLRHQLAATSLLGPLMWLELSNRINDEAIVLRGQGVIVQDQHFVGFYREISQPVRRRCGAFFMTLGGDANQYEGSFLHLGPKTEIPTVGKARWIRR